MFFLIISVPHLLHYLISFRAQSKALDSFPKLNENHILSIHQLPNKFNSHVRVVLVRAVGLGNNSKLKRKHFTVGLALNCLWYAK